MAFKSSDLVQKTEPKRLALKSQQLPEAADFTKADSKVMMTQWDDGSGHAQLVFSTYDGTNINHWVVAGVEKDANTLDAWSGDGTYEQIIRAIDLDSSFDVTSRTVSLNAATSSKLGGIKIGSSLQINGDGVVEVSVSPTSIPIVADESARLALPTSSGAQLAIQQDTGETWGIEASQDTSVAGNWKQIGSAATSVVSFNGRTGGVSPTYDDYQAELVPATDSTTGKKYVLAVQNGVPGILEIVE